jgi:hypothetical protein
MLHQASIISDSSEYVQPLHEEVEAALLAAILTDGIASRHAKLLTADDLQ